LKQVISVLHPTPAVCGFTKQEAKDFILENEGTTGNITLVLGELNKEGFNKDTLKSDLYVNLRCMKIMKDQAHLYMGCSITKDSNPRKEWEESVNKSMTMKRVL
jgi:isochorismate synthase